jgi:hypothetical protein
LNFQKESRLTFFKFTLHDILLCFSLCVWQHLLPSIFKCVGRFVLEGILRLKLHRGSLCVVCIYTIQMCWLHVCAFLRGSMCASGRRHELARGISFLVSFHFMAFVEYRYTYLLHLPRAYVCLKVKVFDPLLEKVPS